MNSQLFNTTVKPVIGVIILALLSVVFLIIGTINEAFDHEIERAEDFLEITKSEVAHNIKNEVGKLEAALEDIELEDVVFETVVNDSVSIELVSAFEHHFSGDRAYKGIVILEDMSPRVSIGQKDDIDVVYDYQDFDYETINGSEYRFHLVMIGQEKCLMIERKVESTEGNFSLGLVQNFTYLLSSHFDDYGYNVHFLSPSSQLIKSSGDQVFIENMQEELGEHIFTESSYTNRNTVSTSINDSNYYNKHIVVADKASVYTIVITHPYDKFNLNYMVYGLSARVVIFAILVTAVIATIIYSSQKTKQWIEVDRQFLNDIIEMDKIQIAEINKELKFHKDYINESKLPMIFVDKESFRIINGNNAAFKYYDYTEDEFNDLFFTDICQWESADKSDFFLVDHIKRKGEKEKRIIRVQDGVFNESDLYIITVYNDQETEIDKDKVRMELFHEIRSPLQGAIGAVEMIEKASNNYGEYTSIIKRSLQNVLLMTNNVLAHGKLSNQKGKVYNVSFNLVELVNDVVGTIVYQDKHYNLITGKVQEALADGSLMQLHQYNMQSDEIKLRQILLNLMSNASKYTIDGKVNLDIIITHKDGKDILVFKVTDTGSGMSKDEINHIYDEYSTFAENSKVTSTGIGMNITRKYIDMLGSELHISSEKEVGSTISFSLEVMSQLDMLVPDSNKPKILIVDDDEISCDFLKSMLEKEMNCYVKTMTNESALFNELNHNDYDCLIIDQNLNHFTGNDMIQLIKNSVNKRYANLPIVLMTADTTVTKQLADELIIKPFDHEKVTSVIKMILAYECQNEHDACQYINPEVVDKKVLCETYDSVGNETFLELIDKFMVNSVEDIKKIHGSIEENDYMSVASLLHRLKGSMSYFAPVECQKMIQDLEAKAKLEHPKLKEDFLVFCEAHKKLLAELSKIKSHL